MPTIIPAHTQQTPVRIAASYANTIFQENLFRIGSNLQILVSKLRCNRYNRGLDGTAKFSTRGACEPNSMNEGCGERQEYFKIGNSYIVCVNE